MRSKVTEQGVLIPKELLEGADEVEIHQEQHRVIVVPIAADPILQWGKHPVQAEVPDASTDHDRYLYP